MYLRNVTSPLQESKSCSKMQKKEMPVRCFSPPSHCLCGFWLFVCVCFCLWLFVYVCGCFFLFVCVCFCLWLFVFVGFCLCLFLFVVVCFFCVCLISILVFFIYFIVFLLLFKSFFQMHFHVFCISCTKQKNNIV